MKSNKVILSEPAHLTEETIGSELLHQGKSFGFYTDTVRLPNGKKAQKDYVRYPHAVAVIPFLDQQRMILVRQFRYPIHTAIYEIPAGKMDDPSESRQEAAERELLEETGYRAAKFQYLLSYHPCAGYSTEVIHVFAAHDLSIEEQALDEDEFIDTLVVPFHEALEMIRQGQITDSKTILSLLYFQAFQ